MTVTAPALPSLHALGPLALEQLRREIRRAGPMHLGAVALPHLVTGALSDLHRHGNAWHLERAARKPGSRQATAAPRGHGKTTALVEIPALWHVANCTRRYVVIVSDTYSQAVKRLETITSEIENNPDLRALYPRLRPARDGQGAVVAWRDDELALECGCRLIAAGAGKSIRGAKAGEHRPDLALLDDLEDKGSVATAAAIEDRLRWLLRVLLPLAGPMRGLDVLWVGTILSRAALLNLATGAALDEGQHRPLWARSWQAAVFRAELPGTEELEVAALDPNSGTVEPVTGDLVPGSQDVARDERGDPITYRVREPLWPALTRTDLATARFTFGPESYAAEYLSDPAEGGANLLAPPLRAEWVNPTAPPLERFVRLPSGALIPVARMVRAAALDPQYASAGKDGKPSGSGDPDLASVVVAGAYGRLTFLLDGWVGRDRPGQARRLVELGVAWGCYVGGIESNAAQIVTADAAADLGRLPIRAEPSTGPKIQRALGLAARLGDPDKPSTCTVYVLPGATAVPGYGSPEGVDAVTPYLATFPHGRYDDPVDATVRAVELAHRGDTTPTGGRTGPALGGARTR